MSNTASPIILGSAVETAFQKPEIAGRMLWCKSAALAYTYICAQQEAETRVRAEQTQGQGNHLK